MKGEMTVARYRAIDLTLFAAILAVFETVIVNAATRWFPNEPYTVSAVPAVVAIVMMRWGPWAAIHAALGGLVTCFAFRAGARQYAVYIAGNLLGLGALAMRRTLGAEKIRGDAFLTVVFGLIAALLMQLGRAAVSLLFGAAPVEAAGFLTTDVITLLFTAVIVWIARHLDGVFEDQKHYLTRVSEEREREKGGFQ